MIPCYATYGSRQLINNKSIQEECKIWVLAAEAYGYAVQSQPYQGAKVGKQVASSIKQRLGENVVLRLIKCLTPNICFGIFMDNNFTSFSLFTHLRVTLKQQKCSTKNRSRKCTIIRDKHLRRKERGYFEKYTSSKKAVQL